MNSETGLFLVAVRIRVMEAETGYFENVSRKFYASSISEVFETLGDGRIVGYSAGFDATFEVIRAGSDRWNSDASAVQRIVNDAACWHTHITDGWIARENGRMNDGTYKPIPYDFANVLTFPTNHFPHIPAESNDSSMIAFTESAEKGQRDKQTRMKFGRYLQKYFTYLTDVDVQEYVRLYQASQVESTYTVKYATTESDIRAAYETEMYACDSSATSCMYGKFAHWTVAPYFVYALSPDVRVAIMRDATGTIVGRTVTSEIRKRYVRIYTARSSARHSEILTTKFTEKLHADGYTQGDLRGCRIRRLEGTRGRVIMPYIDGSADYASYYSDAFFKLGTDGGIQCNDTDGYSDDESNRTQCARCNERYDSEDMNGTYEDGDVCNDCIGEYVDATYRVNRTGYFLSDDCRQDCDGEWYTEAYADNNLTYRDDEYHTESCGHLDIYCAGRHCDFSSADDDDFEQWDSENFCEDCYRDLSEKTCPTCSSTITITESTEDIDGDYYCAGECTDNANLEIERREYARENQYTIAL